MPVLRIRNKCPVLHQGRKAFPGLICFAGGRRNHSTGIQHPAPGGTHRVVHPIPRFEPGQGPNGDKAVDASPLGTDPRSRYAAHGDRCAPGWTQNRCENPPLDRIGCEDHVILTGLGLPISQGLQAPITPRFVLPTRTYASPSLFRPRGPHLTGRPSDADSMAASTRAWLTAASS